MALSKGRKLLILGIVLVVIDQVIKILVKTNMSIGEHFNVLGNWFQILFIENEGMAFGMKFGGAVGKLALSLFRLVLSGVLIWWINRLVSTASSMARYSHMPLFFSARWWICFTFRCSPGRNGCPVSEAIFSSSLYSILPIVA